MTGATSSEKCPCGTETHFECRDTYTVVQVERDKFWERHKPCVEAAAHMLLHQGMAAGPQGMIREIRPEDLPEPLRDMFTQMKDAAEGAARRMQAEGGDAGAGA